MLYPGCRRYCVIILNFQSAFFGMKPKKRAHLFYDRKFREEKITVEVNKNASYFMFQERPLVLPREHLALPYMKHPFFSFLLFTFFFFSFRCTIFADPLTQLNSDQNGNRVHPTGLVLISELFLLCSNSGEAIYGGPDPLLLQTGHRLQVCRTLFLANVANFLCGGIARF